MNRTGIGMEEADERKDRVVRGKQRRRRIGGKRDLKRETKIMLLSKLSESVHQPVPLPAVPSLSALLLPQSPCKQ